MQGVAQILPVVSVTIARSLTLSKFGANCLETAVAGDSSLYIGVDASPRIFELVTINTQSH
jgi:hypothetical protein